MQTEHTQHSLCSADASRKDWIACALVLSIDLPGNPFYGLPSFRFEPQNMEINLVISIPHCPVLSFRCDSPFSEAAPHPALKRWHYHFTPSVPQQSPPRSRSHCARCCSGSSGLTPGTHSWGRTQQIWRGGAGKSILNLRCKQCSCLSRFLKDPCQARHLFQASAPGLSFLFKASTLWLLLLQASSG